jgi:signal transduction histidine kinase
VTVGKTTVHRSTRQAGHVRHSARRETLHRLVSTLESAPDVGAAMEAGLDTALDALGCSAGSVHVVDAAGTLRLVASRALPSDVQSRLQSVGAQEEPFARALHTGDPVVIPGVAIQEASVGAYSLLPRSTLAAVPVRPARAAAGALVVLRDSVRPFGPNDVMLLAVIAAQMAVSLDASRREAQAAARAAANERQRLARDLHDSAVQLLHGVALFSESGRRALAQGDLRGVEQALVRVSAIGQQALAELRMLVHSLQPASGAEFDLIEMLQQRLDIVERRTGVDADMRVEGELNVPPALQEQLYRIAQEALNNTLRHSGASQVAVVVRADATQVEVEVTDNGAGFDLDEAPSQHGLGLASMRARAEQIGGQLSIRSSPGAGATVVVSLDVPRLGAAGREQASN